MEHAPTPISLEQIEIININDLKDKQSYKFNDYDIIIGLFEENIIFHCIKDENIFEISQNYNQITNKIPNFKICQNINLVNTLLKKLFNSGRIEIKNDDEENITMIIKLKDILGNDEDHNIKLPKKELDTKTKMNIMNKKIKNLENKVEELSKENKDIKEKLNVLYNLYNENKLLKEENDKLKNGKKIEGQNMALKFNNIVKDSNIISSNNQIKLILNEIEKQIGLINQCKLIYRATENGTQISDFHSKCDNIRNTLLIIRTDKNYIFGGFTSTGWKNTKGSNIYDEKAFCFSLNLNKIYNIINPKNALHIQSTDGRPSFGSNKYVFLLQNNFLNTTSNYVEKITDYTGENNDYEINGGKQSFKVDELEVFQII